MQKNGRMMSLNVTRHGKAKGAALHQTHLEVQVPALVSIAAQVCVRCGLPEEVLLAAASKAGKEKSWQFLFPQGKSHRLYTRRCNELHNAYDAMGVQPIAEFHIRGGRKQPLCHRSTVPDDFGNTTWVLVNGLPERKFNVHANDTSQAQAARAEERNAMGKVQNFVSELCRSGELDATPTGRIYLGSLGPRRSMLGIAEVKGEACLRCFNQGSGEQHKETLESSMRLILPVSTIRFSHDRISEKFACGKSILQMVLEIYTARAAWANLDVEDTGQPEVQREDKGIIPIIAVTQVEGKWHVLFGNRRLAAAKLLAMYLPEEFETMPVAVGLRPDDWMAQRFTTPNSGVNVIIKETSEFISNQEASYGTELLECLFQPS